MWRDGLQQLACPVGPLFTDRVGWVDGWKLDPIGVSNGAGIDPRMVLTTWV